MGAHICTSCHRCTDVCPAGINLQDLWFSIREDLARLGHPQPYIYARDTVTRESAEKVKAISGPIQAEWRSAAAKPEPVGSGQHLFQLF